MNNKGFISTSVIYSFFIIFLLLLAFIVDGLVSNRFLLYNSRNTIISRLNNDNENIVSNNNPSITKFEVITTTNNTVKVRVTAKQSVNSGNNSVTLKYYFKIGQGSYSESSNNEYTFNGLEADKEYMVTVKVKQLDSSEHITTREYSVKTNK